MNPTLCAMLLLTATMAALSGCKPSNPPPPQTTNSAATLSQPAVSNSDMVQIPGGHFSMGDKSQVDAVPHEVVVSSFLIDKYLVTQEQFQKVMGKNPSRWKGERNPVEQLRWSDATAFCNKRSEMDRLQPCYDVKTGHCNFQANGYRLPTEAEWEYACRSRTATAYFFGDSAAKLGEYAWYDKNAGGHPQPVGRKLPNAWGLYDMCGNVWEWCNDFYKVDYYQESPRQDPTGPASGDTKVLRGGAWRFSAESCRSGYRYNENPGQADVCFGYDIYGFRCVRSLPGNAMLAH